VETVGLDEYCAGRGGLQILRPACRYERKPAVLVNPEATTAAIRRRYRKAVSAETPREGVALLSDVTLFGPGIMRLADGRVLAESLERVGIGPFPDIDPDAAPAHVFETAVHVSKRGSDNYGHFLVEVLPRLVINAGGYPPDAPILLNERSRPFARPILEEAGIDPGRVIWIGDEPVVVKQLYWPTRTTFHRLVNSPHVFPFLRRLGQQITADQTGTRRRLFVSRRDARTRQLLNDNAAFEELEFLGFERFAPGHAPFTEQVRTFAGADFVVAVGGAALTNMVFMPPGGTVVMIGPATMAGYFFWDLATHCGHEFIVLWGENAEPSAAGKNPDFRIDVAALGNVVAEATARPARAAQS
jgi:capsular polysaccharide biosynthesis protein